MNETIVRNDGLFLQYFIRLCMKIADVRIFIIMACADLKYTRN